MKSFVWVVVFYNSETQTIFKIDKMTVEIFETWCWRRILKISQTDKVKNKDVRTL